MRTCRCSRNCRNSTSDARACFRWRRRCEHRFRRSAHHKEESGGRMRTVDNSEQRVTATDIDDEPRRRIPRSGGRFRRQISRAGVVTALVTTAIGITLVVRADSGPPAHVNEAQAHPGEPTVQTLDCGAVPSEAGAVNASTMSDASSEISVPDDGTGSTDTTADSGIAPPAVDPPDPGAGQATATESTTATTTDTSTPASTAASAGASFSATASLSIQILPGVPDPGAVVSPTISTAPTTSVETSTVTVTADPRTETTTLPATTVPTATLPSTRVPIATLSTTTTTAPAGTTTTAARGTTTKSTTASASTSIAASSTTSTSPEVATTPGTTTSTRPATTTTSATKPPMPTKSARPTTPSIAHPPTTSPKPAVG